MPSSASRMILGAFAATVVVGCNYSPPVAGPGDGTGDGPVIPCDAPTLTCADDKTLRATCAGAEDVLMGCPWGCRDDEPVRCGEVVPAGGAVVPEDLDAAGLGDFALSGTVDGDRGEINGGVAAGVVFRATTGVGIFRFRSLHVTGAVTLDGDRAIALVASGDVVIDGVIDARGPCGAGAGRRAGPGGGDGGIEENGSGAGSGVGDNTSNQGGGGAGHGAVGGKGGGSLAGGGTAGDARISVLVGGGGGGGGKTSDGGGGGGAVQIVSNTSITISASSGINAGGCGGGAGDGNSDAGGGGGGAGGTILLEAPIITISGGLAVNGGGGGNRQNGSGTAGRFDRVRAPAASGGGLGGAGNVFAGGAGTGSGTDETNGGGGGGVGRIRLNTGTGGASELVRTTATLSPDLDDGPGTTASHAAATTR